MSSVTDSVPPPAYNVINPLITDEELLDETFFMKSSFDVKGGEEKKYEGHNAKSTTEQQYESQPTVNVADNFLTRVGESISDPNWTEKKPVMVTNRNQYMNRRKIDSIDLLDLTGGLIHHESPYDCALPYRNGNSKAPIMAFKQNDDVFESTIQDQDSGDKYSGNKYASYGVNYRDSFLEGSAAYGVQSPRNLEKVKRESVFKRTFSLKRMISSRRKNVDSQETQDGDPVFSSRNNVASSEFRS